MGAALFCRVALTHLTSQLNVVSSVRHRAARNRALAWTAAALLAFTVLAAGPASAANRARRSAGSAFAWGNNSYGQFGDGTTSNSYTPVQVNSLSAIVDLAAGGMHTVVLKSDGTVWAFGRNSEGQLGNGTTGASNTPVQVNGISGVVAVVSGWNFNAVLKSDGTVWTWGYNYDGELGLGTTTSGGCSCVATATQVSSLSNVVAIAGGSYHILALKSDGTVWSWGQNSSGELGIGNFLAKTSPVEVSGLTGVAAIAAGNDHSVAVKSDGTVWAWGDNSHGALGGGTTQSASTTPLQVTNISDVVSVSAGRYYSVAVKSDGSAWAWGYNYYGELGNGTTADSSLPLQVSNLSGVRAVVSAEYYSLALKSDGTVWAWGYNNDGNLGNGSNTTAVTPVQASGISGVVAIAAGGYHAVAVQTQSSAQAWGYNHYGQLGDGTTTDRHTPVVINSLNNAIALASGANGYHTLALKSDGTVWGWGYNVYGQLGNGTSTGWNTLVQTNSLAGAISVAAGSNHSLALKSDGTVWGWGSNGFGALGTGSIGQAFLSPVQANISGVVAIAAGNDHSIALESNGTVWTFGWNGMGQLGNGASGTGTGTGTPTQINGLSGVIAIAAGANHSVAVRSDGTVWAWGSNSYGQLGDGTTTDRSIPVQVTGLSDVIAVAAGNFHTLALKSDGTVWAWGWNAVGQLGNSTTTDSSIPVQVSTSGVVTIASGLHHNLAITSDGNIWTWGYDLYGQLGDGTADNLPHSTPVSVSSLSGATAVAGGAYHGLAIAHTGAGSGPAATTTTLVSDVNPAAPGVPVKFTATVEPVVAGACVPTSQVIFKDNTSEFAWAILDNNSQATVTVTNFSAGSHSVTATYMGNAACAGSLSPILTQVVSTPNSTTSSLASSENPSYYGNTVTFTATVSGTSCTGTVSFMEGTNLLGTGTLGGNGRATWANNRLAVGPHDITASYGGDANCSSSTSGVVTQTVNKQWLVVSADNKTMAAGAAVPALTYGISGLASFDTSAAYSGTPILTTTATSSSLAGQYPITATIGTLHATNYSFYFLDGTLTVTGTAPPIAGLTPTITSITPATAMAGSGDLTITVVGAGFMSGAKIRCDGEEHNTTVAGATQLTATMPAHHFASPGMVTISVINPAPGGTSSSFTFVVDTASSASGGGGRDIRARGGADSLSVGRGQSATLPVSFTSNPAGMLVSAQCVNLPPGVSCSYSSTTQGVSFSTSSTTPPASYQVTVVFTISWPGAAFASLTGLPLVMLWLGMLRRRGVRMRILAPMAILLIALLVGCGFSPAPELASTVTVQSSVPVTITVTP
ncbi:MAG: Ig-like domain repeat protein [Terriglobales bacterium]